MESLSGNGLLEQICDRARAGEPLAVLRAELLVQLLPLYQRRAQRAARVIGAFVDAAEIESRVLERIWKLIETNSLEDASELQRLLSICENRARKDASRSADSLARTVRRAHRQFQQLVEHEAQARGGDLTFDERRDIAMSVCTIEPTSTVLDQIMYGAPSIYGIDDSYDSTVSTSTTSRSDGYSEAPEDVVIRAEEQEAVQDWIDALPRKQDRHVLGRRYSGEHPLSAPLSQHIKERALRHGGEELADIILTA
jgi:hypothetical protein